MWKQACDALDPFIKFPKSNKNYNSAELINLCIIYVDFLKEEIWIANQHDIRHFFKCNVYINFLLHVQCNVRITVYIKEVKFNFVIFVFL